MKKIVALLLCAFSAMLFAAGKPAAIFGHPSDVSTLTKAVLKPAGLKFEIPKKWLAPAEMSKYAVIYFGERNGGATFSPAFTEYVKNGGIVIFTGSAPTGFTGKVRDLSAAKDFLGFAYIGNMGKVKVESVVFNDSPESAALKFAGKTITWGDGYNAYPSKIKSAKVLANARSGKKAYPALLVNKLGKGEVWWINPMYFRFVRNQKNTGFADEEGRFILTESGKNIESLKALYLAIFKRAADLASEEVKKSSWGTVPLGKAGNIKYDGTFKNKPVYRKAPELKPAFKLAENGKALAQVVISDRKFRYKAAELVYHLNAITGAKFKIVAKRTPNTPAIIFETGEKPSHVIIRTGKDNVVLSGNSDLALFYVLEKLGCRYLWPGKLGKIIPKNPTLWMPDIQMDIEPKLLMRHIRGGGGGAISDRGKLGMTRCGITDFKAVISARRKASYDAAGNSSFFTWHGNGGRPPYSWGHAFGHYYKSFGKTNPDFFALQPDGTRSQAASPDRPRLCMSNPKLVKHIANELIAKFKKNPSRQALSVCLNDGGRTRFCMCEECRKLDPVNAVPAKMSFNVKGVPIAVNYVFLTDRVFTFSNRIAAEVNKVIPGKKVTVYVYSCYSAPPVSVKPSPELVLFSTAMDYTTDKRHLNNLKTLASLSSFGNELFWRPNALRGFGSVVAPQNYARRMFEDVELLKANNTRGMDFDCNEGFWICKGLVYYALCKAMWNPDRLSYDDIVDDYCRAGFGKSAELVKKYFTELEKVFDEAASKEIDYSKALTLEKIAELEKILDEAANTADDPVVKARVDFLKLGLEAGRFSTKLFNAKTGGDNKTYRALQKEYRKFIQRMALEEPLALSPGTIGFRTRFVAR